MYSSVFILLLCDHPLASSCRLVLLFFFTSAKSEQKLMLTRPPACGAQLWRRSYRSMGGAGLPHVGHAPSAQLLQEQIWLIKTAFTDILKPFKTTEASLIVPNITNSVYSSSYSFLFFGLILSLLFFLCLFFCIPSFLGYANKKEETKKREWGQKRDNYMNCCTQK